ncbi:hypothetical protein BHE74_00039792 [Ensete ventricosum]|uniref:Uncharacterized protein n=1 Tax=Ensete ventricosum TaxID=4639 RepID=A0A444D889_ENSVE|nr:hypothetical protein B296_00035810 [Ensete ventricosum]RWV94329.1 hypothetical protein GW17_00043142 [Ensete ventricosum]RWW53697.1 hypothetical protein BHE74_00039792 [Ensete ventricosum]
MGNCSRKHQGVFCFSASSLDDEAIGYRGEINPESPHYLRSRQHRRVVAKVLGSTAVSAFLVRVLCPCVPCAILDL